MNPLVMKLKPSIRETQGEINAKSPDIHSLHFSLYVVLGSYGGTATQLAQCSVDGDGSALYLRYRRVFYLWKNKVSRF